MQQLKLVCACLAVTLFVTGCMNEQPISPDPVEPIQLTSTVPISASVTSTAHELYQIRTDVTLPPTPRNGTQTAVFYYIVVKRGTTDVVATDLVIMGLGAPGSSDITVPATVSSVSNDVQVKNSIAEEYTVIVVFNMPTGIGNEVLGGAGICFVSPGGGVG